MDSNDEKKYRELLSANIKRFRSRLGLSPKHLDDIDEALIKYIEEAVRPTVKKSIAKMHRYYTKISKQPN